MADGLITRDPVAAAGPQSLRSRSATVLGRLRASPWWLRVLAIFVASRLVSTAFLLIFAAMEPTTSWTVQHPDYGSFARIWDGQWYYVIATLGYPKTLPLVDVGGALHVGQNAWAFLPVYPYLVKGFMLLTGAAFPAAGVFVSVVAAAGAALVFHRLVSRFLPAGSALFAVALFCFAPLSPLMQVTYAESLFLLLVAASLLFLLQRRYWLMLATAAVASFTRPGMVALALVLVLHWAFRWWNRRTDPFPGRDRVVVIVVAVVTGVLGLAWPVVAWIATGDRSAYTETELAWRADYIGYGKLVPFTSWVQGADWWFPGGSGVVFLAVAVVLFALFLLSPWVRRLPVDLRLWSVAYALYLLAVFFPQSSTFRVLMPLFPLLGALAVPRSKVFRVALLVLCVVGQWVWIYYCWWVNGADWTPP
ncbi:hypothetical protein [Frondihabitans cladoniiphilus]|uniref:Mannosyltransferase PIG-V n=1 Tax=Frondihabitans cladoniiphilus TaxID=715785 RepID=A0ABP8VST2_9MICO